MENFIVKIKEQSNINGIMLDDKQIKMFYEYMNLLVDWNEKMNLTAITEENEVILKHFIDSIVISSLIEDKSKIIDVGTGAGFPGIPLKIHNHTLEVTLLDSLNKRIQFLNCVIENLGLEKIITVHSRVEDFAKNSRESFDIAVSRAVARLNILVEYMLPLVKVGGKCICMKANDMEKEIEEAKKAIKVLGGKIEKVEEITLANTDIKRTIIIIRKEKSTPKAYPRKAGMASKNPII